MSTITGNQSANVSGTKYIDSRCIVEFRPNDNWKGEYGFDWYRRGDTEENINGTVTKSEYKTIVGKYVPRDPDYGESAGTLQIDKPGANPEKMYYADKLAREEYPIFKIKGIARNYIAPYISLYYMSTRAWKEGEQRYLPKNMLYQKDGVNHEQDFCKMETSVKVLIDAKNINKIEFTCDKSLKITPNILTGIPNGESTKTVTIRYNYAFSDGHQSIKVFAYHKDGVTKTFAGQINVVKCEPKTVDICFVNVKVSINRSVSLGIPDQNFAATQEDNLKRFFSQAHVIPNITTRSLDLDQSRLSGFVTMLTSDGGRTNFQSIIVNGVNNDNNFVYRLEQWFNEENPSLSRAYKVFFIGEKGYAIFNNQYIGLAGIALNIPSKTLVVYKDPDESVVCHEILHCFGLWHSFSNESRHTFEKFKTNNIMDYSTNTISLWRWQWNVIGNAPDVNKI